MLETSWNDARQILLQDFRDHPALQTLGIDRCERDVPAVIDGQLRTLLQVDRNTCTVRLASIDAKTPGLTPLLVLGRVFVAFLLNRRTEREALYAVLDIYRAMPPTAQSQIRACVAQPGFDPGHTFSLFLQRAGGDALAMRDRDITWLLAQSRIDLPYDRLACLRILASKAETDQQRRQIYQILRGYDREREYGNIQRLSRELREAGESLIFGRMSRAFHNQGMLFANAAWLQPGEDWPQLSQELASMAEQADETEAATIQLQLHLNSPREVALIQMEGALERFEDAVLNTQHQALVQSLKPARECVENHADQLMAGAPEPLSDAIFRLTQARLELAQRIRTSLLATQRRPAAYVVISQRPSPTGSHLLVKLNEFEDPYAGKPDNLRKLTRLAGDRVYGSPDYRWLEHADHWIEAIPLFIKEEIVIENGRETTRTLIDIDGMEESFREEMADHWAANLRHVLESECLALARECMAPADVSLDEQAVLAYHIAGATDPREIAALGLLFVAAHQHHIAEIQGLVEREGAEPYEAARAFLLESEIITLARERRPTFDSWRATAMAIFRETDPLRDWEGRLARLIPEAWQPRRPLPALHVLTTQSAGMTEGFIRTWLEESMALHSIVEDHDLTEQVNARRRHYAARILALSEKLIKELGLAVDVEEFRSTESISRKQAIALTARRNPLLRDAISCLGTLLELEAAGGDSACVDDPDRVETIAQQRGDRLREIALSQVVQRHAESLDPAVSAYCREQPEISEQAALRKLILDDEFYRLDLDAYARMAARRLALDQLDQKHPEWQVQARCKGFFRRHVNLAKTTARKEIVAELGLNHLTLHPLHALRATGAGKRYHLLYTPSRVDLGERERESVETWSQWVGGADQAAANVGRRLYSLINKDVQVYESLREPEVLKTGENASMASHFAFSNALSMMVSATRRGDFETLADQMNRRQDRRIHPAGEGYGGYCVPKDGLFLEFVLSLRRSAKLVQIGLPAASHPAVARLAIELLDRRNDFPSAADWEAWAAERMRSAELGDPGALRPLFQATQVAQAIDGLGQPELRDSGRLANSLAARWGLHKMVTGGEQVNRFMPFFKVWLIRQALAEAAHRNPMADHRPQSGVLVLTAEYKPDTQDGRFSAGMRKFEILAGTGGHLLSALDGQGQDLALLLTEGYEALVRQGRLQTVLDWLCVDPSDETAKLQLQHLFPRPPTPLEIRLVSPTRLSTLDVLNYTSDTQLAQIAEQARAELLNQGYSAREIEANLRTHGPLIGSWQARVTLTQKQSRSLEERLGGTLHALALATLGPEFDYHHALQGADVLDTGIPHQSLLELLGDPGWLCELMLDGNPRSALAIVDGASGARPRAMNKLDVMLWFAAAELHGRESVYRGIGLGEETIESWRATMRRRRRNAEKLRQALVHRSLHQARRIYQKVVDDLVQNEVALTELNELGRLTRNHRARKRDHAYVQALARIARGLPLEELDFSGFLALGGLFLLIGADPEEIAGCRSSIEFGIAALGGLPVADAETWRSLLPIRQRQLPTPTENERLGVESSNKAVEDRPAVALETRRQLAGRLAAARAVNERYQAFSEVPLDDQDFDASYRAAKASLGSGDALVSDATFGRFIGHSRNAMLALARELADGSHRSALAERVNSLCNGRRVDLVNWQAMAGGYEDLGDFGRLAQAVDRIHSVPADRVIDCITLAAELFEILLAIDSIQPQIHSVPDDPLPLWRALAEFFAQTLNDHHYEYRPWLMSRGTGFSHLSGNALYTLAMQRHAWLYRYLRTIAVRHTELSRLSCREQDELLGNFLDGQTVEAIGAEAETPAEQAWRAYGQLRELAFIRNDGFPLPEVFPQFDPEWIAAARRVNHVIAAPVGRTHFSRMLMEGPTLARELENAGSLGANLIISRQIELCPQTADAPPLARVRSGHLVVDAETYRTAIGRFKPEVPMPDVHPKGIRVAARFTRPVTAALVYPFHGLPAYVSGALEAAGLPYSVQSLFHTWTTYDKAKYPAIFQDSGVDLPAEIDWLAAWNQGTDEGVVKDWIETGKPGTTYPGLRQFGHNFRDLIIKDAAESGGRNMRVFKLGDESGELDENQLQEAIDFTYQISRKHNVAIQEVIRCSPEFWATEAFMEDFVRRQIVEWGQAVERQRQPSTPIHGSFRVIVSTDDPANPDPESHWHLSHWITLNSLQIITNVGRGGTLEQLLPEFIQPQHREILLERLATAASCAAQAVASYEYRTAEAYSQETGRAIGEDLMGISYGKPRYLMLDFLASPVFAEAGAVTAIRPRYDEDGQRQGSDYILSNGSRRLIGTLVDWRILLIEPNIGVGLWDRVALREEVHELDRARAEQRKPDWDQIGRNARIVLRDLNRAGEAYLAKVCRRLAKPT